MSIGDTSFATDRRTLLRGAILLVGGVVLSPRALAATNTVFFTKSERIVLDLLCETLIPRTDTPGAIDAGVPAFVEKLMAKWASSSSQQRMRGTIASLVGSARTETGKPLTALSGPAITTWLTAKDAELLRAGDPGYLKFKNLVLTGYYYSEAGATKELRYELVPGAWEPAIAIGPDTRTWAG